jgi:formylglycine-generating enzyme required for sulfatase activity
MRFLTIGLICISFGQIACGDTVIAEEPDQPPAEVIGVECPGYPGMIVVPAINDQSVFCIDAFEASAQTDANFGNPDQSMASEAGDGSTLAIAESQRFVQPVRGVSFYQARAACANSGKRLCSATEWITACRGDGDLTYPYGDVYDREKCNGHDSGRKDVVESGAMFEVQKVVGSKDQAAGCVSQHGAYDMSGNLWEWNSTLYLDNTRRGLVGGSFQSNKAGLRCVTDDNYALPLDSDPAYGFRCCLDYPF